MYLKLDHISVSNWVKIVPQIMPLQCLKFRNDNASIWAKSVSNLINIIPEIVPR